MVGLSALPMIPTAVHAQTPPAAETLSEAWATALAAHQLVAAARRISEASAQTVAAAKAANRPAVGVGGGYTASNHAPAVLIDSPSIEVPGLDVPLSWPVQRLSVGQARSWMYSATASVPLYTSGHLDNAVAAATAELGAAQAAAATTVLDIKMTVADAYVGVLRATSLGEVARSEVGSLSAHARDAANLVAQGVTARNDQLGAELALADARQRQIEAEHTLDYARAVYNRLLGRPLGAAVVLEVPSLPPVAGDLAALTAQAWTARPELAALAGHATAQAHRASQVVASTRPQVLASGGYTYQENRHQLHPGLWSAGVQVRWNVFDGGVARAEAASLRLRAEAVGHRQQDLRTFIELDVRKAWLDLDSAEQRLTVANQALGLADENLRVARDRYTAGVGIATEVLEAEALRARSATNAALASYDRLLSTLRVLRVMGTL